MAEFGEIVDHPGDPSKDPGSIFTEMCWFGESSHVPQPLSTPHAVLRRLTRNRHLVACGSFAVFDPRCQSMPWTAKAWPGAWTTPGGA